jgi:hypothetical protein
MSDSDNLIIMLTKHYHNNTLMFDHVLRFYNRINNYINDNNLELKYNNEYLLFNLILFFNDNSIVK